MGGRVRRPFALGASCVVLLLVFLCAAWTWSAFSGTTANPGNAGTAGTVALTDNDSGSASFTLSDVAPGDTDTSCIQVTYTGSLPALVRLYGTTTGTGLDPYLTLEVTRGTGAGTFDDCTGFTADATNYIGQGAGVVYNGTLTAFADDWTAGVVDPRTASVPEAWTTSEAHVYRLRLTVADNNSAQGKNMTQTFTWEARNTTLYSQVVLSDQPAGYWKLDEAAGTTATDSAGSATGTYTNGPVLNQTTGVKDAGTTVNFGANQYVNVADAAVLNPSGQISVEYWIKTNVLPSSGSWHYNVYKSTSDYSTRVDYTSGFPRFRWILYGPTRLVDGATTVTTGTWYHVVGTYNGSTMKLYVNGQLDASGSATGSITDTAAAFTIGSPTNASQSVLLDEVAVYSYPLSAPQVTEHYNAGHR
jgi:hypothetical protein